MSKSTEPTANPPITVGDIFSAIDRLRGQVEAIDSDNFDSDANLAIQASRLEQLAFEASGLAEQARAVFNALN